MTEIERVLDMMERQLNCSDAFAKDAKPASDPLPSAWEIQNGHLRDFLAQARSALKAKDKP